MSCSRAKLCIVQPNLFCVSETFLRTQEEHLPADVTVLYGQRPQIKGAAASPRERVLRTWLKAARWIGRKPQEWEVTELLLYAFGQVRPDAVLAQYGPTGVRVMDACQRAAIPLIVHFHGYDAAHDGTLREHGESYRRMFAAAAAIVAVSRAMRERLIALGAPRERVQHNPYGVDLRHVHPAAPASAPPTFLAVGRLIEKKAPQLTIRAFAQVHCQRPEARLRIIGDGGLMPACRQLVEELRLEGEVTFLGAQPHDVVLREMAAARAFVQHSVVSPNGDSEGTPVSILEAGASGLPVVSTRHAGIPDVVIEGQTGLLVEEHDVTGMAAHLRRLAEQPELASALGTAARQHIRANFSVEQRIASLWSIIESCIGGRLKKAA